MVTNLGKLVTYGKVKEPQVKIKYFFLQKTYGNKALQGGDVSSRDQKNTRVKL